MPRLSVDMVLCTPTEKQLKFGGFMNKYLFSMTVDVADEGDVMMTQIFTSKEKNETVGLTWYSGFGNLEGDEGKVAEDDFIEISDVEIEVLRKFGLDSISTGVRIDN